MENYEEYLLLYADGELDEEGRAGLMRFLGQHPELERELALIGSARLTPDTTLVFEGREQLLRKPAAVIWLRSRWTYAAAACLAAMTVLLLMNRKEEYPGTRIVRSHRETGQQDTIQKTEQNLPPVVREEKQVRPVTAKTKKVSGTAVKVQGAPAHGEDLLATLPVVHSRPLDTEVSPKTEAVAVVPVNAGQERDGEGETEMNAFIAALPISEVKKQGLADIREALHNTIQKAEHTIKETTVVVRFGNKSINF